MSTHKCNICMCVFCLFWIKIELNYWCYYVSLMHCIDRICSWAFLIATIMFTNMFMFFVIRDFAYVARDNLTQVLKCHVFRCDTPAKHIATSLHDLCSKVSPWKEMQMEMVHFWVASSSPGLDRQNRLFLTLTETFRLSLASIHTQAWWLEQMWGTQILMWSLKPYFAWNKME